MIRLIIILIVIFFSLGIAHADPFPSYVELYGEDYTFNIDGAGTYQIINGTNGVGGDGLIVGQVSALSTQISISNTTGVTTIGINGAGIYEGSFAVAFTATAADVIHMTFFVNDTEQVPCHLERKMGPGNDVGSTSAQCLLNLSAGDVIDLRCQNDANEDIEFHFINWIFKRVE